MHTHIQEELISEFLEFAEDVDVLRGFVMTNAQALVKICKKHDKVSKLQIKEHFIAVLSRCTFYNSREFGGLIADFVVLSIEIFSRFTGQVPVKEDSFTCEICCHVLCNPLELSCSHRFCNSCVSLSTFFGQHRCPVCFKACVLTEEHMRVHTLGAHLETLVNSSCPTTQRLPSHPADNLNNEVAGGVNMVEVGGELGGGDETQVAPPLCRQHGTGCLRRNKSEMDMSVASEETHHTSSEQSKMYLRRNKSDSALDLNASAGGCTLESPCEKCLQRSHHVQMLRRESKAIGPEDTSRIKQSTSSSKRIITERIIQENEERSDRDKRFLEQRDRRLSALSGASAGSAASLLSFIAREFAEEEQVEAEFEKAHVPAPPRVVIPQAPLDPKLMTLKESEGNPWSPSKRWTACPDIFRTSGGDALRRTSSTALAFRMQASEMWGKVAEIELQVKHDRTVRMRLWILELSALVNTIFFCIRVGHPDLLCPAPEESEYVSRVAILWQNTVCGSWFGLMTPGGKEASEHLDVVNLQRQRTHSLHVTLDNMVRTSSSRK